MHTNVLWALETVAWSPAYFSRATDILARLDQLDPGGRLSNRPAATLTGLFRPWHPDTAASAMSRLTVFDTLRRRHPNTAWKLGLALLPESHGVHFPNSSPGYRDWKPSELPVTRAEYMEFVTALVERCTADAGDDPARWVQLVEHYSDLSPSDQTLIRDRLTAQIDRSAFDDGGRERIWNQMRDLVGNHREFSDARWSLPEQELTKLDGLIEALAPTSARARHEWLFQNWTPHLGDARRRDDFEAYDAMVTGERERAIGDIVDEAGLDEVRDLARSVRVTHAVGWALAGVRPNFDDALIAHLDSDEDTDFPLSVEYFARRFRDSGWPWLTEFIETNDLTAAQRGRLLLATRDFPKAWEMADTDPDVADYFWDHFSPLGLGGDFDHIDFVATKLMSVGRNAGALHFLNIYLTGRSELRAEHFELILRGLEGLLGAQDDKEMASLRAYDFESLFEYLDTRREKLDTDRLAKLQWAYLPALGYDAKVPTLATQLATSPDFFVEVVCSIYRRRDGKEDDPKEADDRSREATASNGYRLLSAWNEPPGLDGQTMNLDALRSWTDAVEPALLDRDRLEVGLQHLGQALASTPADADGIWPGEVVRDFLEERQDESIENGMYLAVLNNRGVTTRSLDEGGQQERQLAAKFNGDAARVADTAPQTAALLRRIAKSYEIDARRQDDQAEQFKRGLN